MPAESTASVDPSGFDLQPLTVTAHLQAGIAHSHAFGIALDGLLASQIHAEAKAALWDAGGAPARVVDLDDVEDLDLPLARCTAGGGQDWHWAATFAWPHPIDALKPGEPGDSAAPSPGGGVDLEGEGADLEVRHWYSFPDHHILERLACALPQHVDDERGRWRRYAMPQLVTLTPALTWRAVGDIDAIRTLLTPIRAIGKGRARGEGTVQRWEITPTPALTAWESGHLHPDGTLGRPVPSACLTGAGEHGPIRDAGLALTGIRPPYLHPTRRRRLHRPLPWHHDHPEPEQPENLEQSGQPAGGS